MSTSTDTSTMLCFCKQVQERYFKWYLNYFSKYWIPGLWRPSTALPPLWHKNMSTSCALLGFLLRYRDGIVQELLMYILDARPQLMSPVSNWNYNIINVHIFGLFSWVLAGAQMEVNILIFLDHPRAYLGSPKLLPNSSTTIFENSNIFKKFNVLTIWIWIAFVRFFNQQHKWNTKLTNLPI